tara:strand:+ start:7005 stop:7802 length:798 start_codon:yes stop_codon:yes gene_type:complete
MFKAVSIIITLTLVTNTVTHYLLQINTATTINELQERVFSRLNTASQETSSTLKSVEDQILGSNNLINSYIGRLIEIENKQQLNISSVNSELESFRTVIDELSDSTTITNAQVVSAETKVNTLESKLDSIIKPLEILRADIHNLESQLAYAIRSDTDANINNDDNLMQSKISPIISEHCPIDALNRAEKLTQLKKELERITSIGKHDVTVKFDIDNHGELILQQLESTAPANVLGAVERYVDGLIFDSDGSVFLGCEALVKLEII